MSAALKTSEVHPRPQHTATPKAKRRLRVIHTPMQLGATIAFPKSTPGDYPLWLKLLIAGQRLSLLVALITVGGVLSAYALTVNNNRRITAATATLGQLQEQQQQLTTANAVFKSNLAKTAIKATQNGTLHPKDVIFLEADEVSPAVAIDDPVSQENRALTDERFFPKGY